MCYDFVGISARPTSAQRIGEVIAMLDEEIAKSLARSIKEAKNAECCGYVEKLQGMEDNSISRIERELEKLNQDFDKYCTDQAAYQAAAEHREKIAAIKGFWRGVLAGTIGSTIAGLIVLAVQNWSGIISFFTAFFH